ncbi:phosphoribosyltransferase family protein [Frondihabitans australicus]|uniref:Adenine phosphoribosyltransferase n=1 Tax=Frondihabitans australicus TaxID=386892 RepID=A0A495IGU7_9MICO|nr:phosphoribosyltransferase family protein [Frondihabitans australicus]RKR75184.1 adenine phosphoribosyltransferase [Frondihabitans australicus]
MTATHSARIGTQTVELPLVAISPDLTIALLMVIDHGVEFVRTACAELGDAFRDAAPEIVVAPATLGIPLAIETTRALGLDDYLILQKTNKVHLRDALREPLEAITTAGRQELLLDRARLGDVAGRRVLFVDDVLSTGSSAAAGLRLLESAGAEVVGVGALLAEGSGWRDALHPYLDRIVTLGTIPTFDGEGRPRV